MVMSELEDVLSDRNKRHQFQNGMEILLTYEQTLSENSFSAFLK